MENSEITSNLNTCLFACSNYTYGLNLTQPQIIFSIILIIIISIIRYNTSGFKPKKFNIINFLYIGLIVFCIQLISNNVVTYMFRNNNNFRTFMITNTIKHD